MTNYNLSTSLSRVETEVDDTNNNLIDLIMAVDLAVSSTRKEDANLIFGN